MTSAHLYELNVCPNKKKTHTSKDYMKNIKSDLQRYNFLSYDVASGSEITPCNKIDKPLVVYRFSGNVMMP